MISKPARVALHMADATATDLPRRRPARHAQRAWKAWMHVAAMAIASALTAIVVVALMRRGLLL